MTDHFDGERFFNPRHPSTDKSLLDVLKWRLTSRAADWPQHVAVKQAVPLPQVAGLRATMVGHATVLIQVDGLNVLTDPIWSERASPGSFAGPRRITAPGIDFDQLPQIHVVLLSHNHYDHCDLPTLRRLHARDRPLIVAPLGNAALLRRHMPDVHVAAADWDEQVGLEQGGSVHVVPAYHWSGRSLSDRRKALWGGFMLRSRAGQLVYFAGDTGYGEGEIFRQMRTRYGAPELAILPIGAYAPRWFMKAQHNTPAEAVRMMADVGAARAIGIHWGSFRLSDEPREEPAMLLRESLASEGIDPQRLVPVVPGQEFDCN